MKMKQYFRRVLKDRRVMLGRDAERTGWGMTFKLVVDEGVKAEAIQELKERKGKSVLETYVFISDEAMEELVWLYENHPERDNFVKFELIFQEGEDGKWEKVIENGDEK